MLKDLRNYVDINCRGKRAVGTQQVRSESCTYDPFSQFQSWGGFALPVFWGGWWRGQRNNSQNLSITRCEIAWRGLFVCLSNGISTYQTNTHQRKITVFYRCGLSLCSISVSKKPLKHNTKIDAKKQWKHDLALHARWVCVANHALINASGF